MKASLFAICVGSMSISGCVVADTGTPEAEDTCGAAELQNLVGQPKTVLETMRFGQPLRVIGYGMAVTMDYSPARLNIDVGEDGVIIRLWCG